MAQLKDRYAAALFEMSLDSGEVAAHLAEAARVRGWLEQEGLADLLEHPHIPSSTKRELLANLFGEQLSPDLMGFLHLAVEKNRAALIVPTLEAFLALGDAHRGKTMAYVVSATALDAGQVETLGALLSKKLGKKTEVSVQEDADLIGGFRIHVDGRLIDRSVRTQLKNLKESLERGGPNDNQT